MLDILFALAAILADPPALLVPIADAVGGWVMFDPAVGWSIQR